MRLRTTLALLVALAGPALVGPAAVAQAAPTDPAYPPQTCPTISVSTTHPSVGETITVAGREFDAGERVTLVLHSKTYVLGTATTGADGTFSKDVTMPAGLTGNHVISVRGAQSACPADPIQIFVQGPSTNSGEPGGPGGTPAVTGFDILGLLAAAAALIGLGVLLNRRNRRSRHRPSARL